MNNYYKQMVTKAFNNEEIISINEYGKIMIADDKNDFVASGHYLNDNRQAKTRSTMADFLANSRIEYDTLDFNNVNELIDKIKTSFKHIINDPALCVQGSNYHNTLCSMLYNL